MEEVVAKVSKRPQRKRRQTQFNGDLVTTDEALAELGI